MICVQSIKHLHRALVACYECAVFLAARPGPAKPPDISPEHVQPLPVLSFYNPVSVFNKICSTSKKNPIPCQKCRSRWRSLGCLSRQERGCLSRGQRGSRALCSLAFWLEGDRAAGARLRVASGLGTHWGRRAGQRDAVRAKRSLSCLARAGERGLHSVSLH